MCATLAVLGGNHFQKIGSLVVGVSQQCVSYTMKKVVRIINRELKDEFLHLPDQAMLQANAAANQEKYHLPNFGYAVDGVHMVFEEMPRDIPIGRNAREFHNRKSRYF